MRLTAEDRSTTHSWELRGLAAVLPGGIQLSEAEAAASSDALLAFVRAMCDASPFGIFLAGPGGECLYVNPAGQRIMGIDAETARGRGWMTALHPEDRERIIARWGSAVAARAGNATPVHRFVHANGEVRAVEVRALPLAGQTHHGGFLGILEDVTDRERAEAERADAGAHAEAARIEAEAARAEVASILEPHLGRLHRARSRGRLHVRERSCR